MEKTLGELVKEAEQNDLNGETTLSKYVTQNMREDINKTEAYYNSQFTHGNKDADGREKPFKNICYPAVNIWYRATDIDAKDLKIIAKNDKQVIPALLATIKLREWMNKVNFGQFLNEWGHVLAKHGSAVIEIVKASKELSIRCLDWNNIIVDAIDFDGNIKIKRLWLSPAQLRKNKLYNKEKVKELLDNLQSRETSDGTKKDNKAGYVEVFEVHGELPKSFLTDNEKDEEEYVTQMHVICLQGKKDSKDFNEYSLFKGPEKKEPMMNTHLVKVEGQSYVGGAVKNLFQTQWMINDSEKMIRDHLLIASKVVFQGSDGTMEGANFFSEVDNGQYLLHKPNEPMTRVQNTPDIEAMRASRNDWIQHGNTSNGIADAMISQANSGTAWRQTQAELTEAHSLFELMVETKGLYLKQMFKDYLLEYFIEQLDNNDPIAGFLTPEELKNIDSRYLPNETIRRVNDKKKQTILGGNAYNTSMEAQHMAEAGQAISSELSGNQRFIYPSKKTWKEEFKDLDWDNLELDVTGESENTTEKMATLNTALMFLASKQGQPLSEDEQVVFSELMKASGSLSPLKLSFNQGKKAALPAAPTQQPAMAGAMQ